MEKRSTPSLQITDRFGAQAAFASLRLPDGTEATVPAEHAAAIYVNEQPAGLMSTESAEAVEEKLQALKAALKAHGISEDIDAFMTLAFVSLPVIPKLRLNTYGIVDVDAQQIVPAVF